MSEGGEKRKQNIAQADDILKWLAKRVGSVASYESKEDGGVIAAELFERFGVYNASAVYRRWQMLIKKPDLLHNRTLKKIAMAAKAEHGFDPSFLGRIISESDPAWLPTLRLAEELDVTEDIERQKQLLVRLRAELLKLIRIRKLTGFTGGQERRLTLKDFEHDSLMVNLPGVMTTVNHITSPLQRAAFNIRFEETVGRVDREKLAADTLKYGAKGANLEALRRVQQAFASLGMEGDFQIPDYRLLDTTIYDLAQSGERIMPAIQEVYRWAKDKKIIVRSSAVYSEDSEDSTGAGIYDSIEVGKGCTPREFLMAVKTVYASVNSAKAIAYRKERNIPQEKMGLVVQEFIESSPAQRGQANTTMKNVPELLEIAYEDGTRPLIVKQRALEALAHHDTYHAAIMHYEIDWNKKSPHEVKDLGFLFTLLERHYGQGIQIEFLQARDEYDLSVTYIVQARFLPKSFSEKKVIEFPDEAAVFEGRAVGAFDVTLPVLHNKRDNAEKEGVVVFQSSEFATLEGIERSIPKSGGVIILRPGDGGGGHIETLCAEKELALVFSNEDRVDNNDSLMRIQMGIKSGVRVPIYELGGYRTLRLVGNGLEGRVYGQGYRMKQEGDPDFPREEE